MAHLPYHWKERFCQVLLIAPVSKAPEVMLFLDSWAEAEGGTAENNPLNTTLTIAGCTLYNDAGVKNYPTAVTGICATACTLAQMPVYSGLWKDMQKVGAYKAEDLVNRNRDAISTWGTNPDVILRVISEHR